MFGISKVLLAEEIKISPTPTWGGSKTFCASAPLEERPCIASSRALSSLRSRAPLLQDLDYLASKPLVSEAEEGKMASWSLSFLTWSPLLPIISVDLLQSVLFFLREKAPCYCSWILDLSTFWTSAGSLGPECQLRAKRLKSFSRKQEYRISLSSCW